MNLLMLILIFLALWIAGAIAYFAWTLMPKVPKPPEPIKAPDAGDTQASAKPPDSE